MTQKDFTNLTKVEVERAEFEAIHTVYIMSDLDKEEFCKMWKKMNKSRVEHAKAVAKQKSDLTNRIENLLDVEVYLESFGSKSYGGPAIAVLDENQVALLTMEDIDLTWDYGGFKCIGSAIIAIKEKWHEIEKKLKSL